jgi:hypothetical protein
MEPLPEKTDHLLEKIDFHFRKMHFHFFKMEVDLYKMALLLAKMEVCIGGNNNIFTHLLLNIKINDKIIPGET